MGRHDWYRSTVWDAQIAAEFENRLRRTRDSGRVQYLSIQGSHLMASDDEEVRLAGRELIRRVIADYPDSFEAKSAWEQLGQHFAELGDLGQAEHALRQALHLCQSSPIGRSGTTGVPDLWLAEVLLRRPGLEQLDEVDRLLHDAAVELSTHWSPAYMRFRLLLAQARTAARRHVNDAAEFASAALAVTQESGIGPATPTDAELNELRRIAGSP
jgi:tetratricopeptide (TPR) repeat protein